MVTADPAVSNSILNSTKKNLNLPVDYTAFDQDIIMLINSALSTLDQLGIGPEGGFSIEDETATWEHLLGGDKRLNNVKTYVHLKCRLIFDPPPTSFGIAAIEKQVEQLEWRINVVRENDTWAPPVVLPDDEFGELILDGGSA